MAERLASLDPNNNTQQVPLEEEPVKLTYVEGESGFFYETGKVPDDNLGQADHLVL